MNSRISYSIDQAFIERAPSSSLPSLIRCISTALRRMFCSTRCIKSLVRRQNKLCGAALSPSAIFSSLGSSTATPTAPPRPSVLRRPLLVFDGPSAPPPLPPAPREMDPVARLTSGFKQFKEEVYEKNTALFTRLAEIQKPKFMVFACADSRVCPSVVLNLQPGEAFTVRNIANIVPPFDQTRYSGAGAAIEFSVLELKIESIVVMGHSRCAGINRLMSIKEADTSNIGSIDDWLKVCLPAREKVRAQHSALPFEDQCTHCEKEAVNLSLRNLMTYPFVKDRVEKRALKLIGAHYNFVIGSFDTWVI